MNNLEGRIGTRTEKSFLRTLKSELKATGNIYLQVIRRPSLLAKGIYQVTKDIIYELPKSLIT